MRVGALINAIPFACTQSTTDPKICRANRKRVGLEQLRKPRIDDAVVDIAKRKINPNHEPVIV